MADRIFAGALFLVALAYTYIAFFILQAPFQYDPLGPESWPQILGVVALLCLAYVFIRPDKDRFDLPY
ncbi:tripartite tricarboxylate transporter TctB family protein, partial [Fulvimarina sp. MAC3]